MTQLNLFKGASLRDQGCTKVLSKNREWQVCFDSAAEMLLSFCDTDGITSEDVVSKVGQPTHPNAVGAAMRSFALRNHLVIDRYVKSSKPSRHASVIAVWRKP